MQAPTTVREARLRPGSADQYPTFPVSRWTNAGTMVELVSAWLRLERPDRAPTERTLLESDFEFRGGIVPPYTTPLQ